LRERSSSRSCASDMAASSSACGDTGRPGAAGKGERIRHQDGVAASGQFIGPGNTTIIAPLVIGHHRMEGFGHASNLLPAKVFVSRMVMQGQNAR
jgi:hypothetical protein